MVAKITYGSSIYGAVSYNQQKVDDGTAKVIHTNQMIMNIDGKDLITFQQTLRSFDDYLIANKRTKTPVAHFSLNPSPEDRLTDDQYTQIADDYMRDMGYQDQPYIVYRHNDINREHIHIVTVRVNEQGKKISDSNDFRKSMKICRELEEKYGLQQISNHKQEESILYLQQIDPKRGNIKRQVSNIVKSVLKDYTFQSFGEFNALLSCYNIHCKQVKGEEHGNLYHGIIYSPTDNKGMPVGNPIKSSLIGKSVGYEALAKKIIQHKEKIKKEGLMVSESKNRIKHCMKQATDKRSFTSQLKSYGIDVLFRENEEGRIYGITFIDHNYKAVYNGSRLGKEFSANVFNKLFSETDNKSTQSVTHSENFIPNEPQHYITPYMVDDIFGEFYIHHSGTDPEEEAFRRRMQRKKRKKRKGL